VVMDDFPVSPGYENWFLLDHTFYSLLPGEGAPLVIAVDLEQWTADTLAAVPGIASPSLTISPAGTSLLYSRVDRGESDLKLVESPAWQGQGR